MGYFRVQFIVLVILGLTNKAISDNREDSCFSQHEYDATTPGTISSPFYGRKEYPNGLFCEYRIRAPEGYRIKITFKDLDIDPNSRCGEDSLTVSSKDNHETLGIFCGSAIPYPIISKQGENEIRLNFQTNDMVSGRGFSLQYESSPYFTSLCESGYVQCLNRNCYRSDKKCDGIDDCGDGTDEENCGRPIENFPEKCGIQEIKPNTIFTKSADRMVGGEEAIPNSWPWTVSLHSIYVEPSSNFCGGTLINAQWILTAAHCVSNHPTPGDIIIHLGEHDLYKRNESFQLRRSQFIISYPLLQGEDLQNYNLMNDVSLIKMNAPVTFSKGVQPACLPYISWKTEPGWHCYSTGWGETRGSGYSDKMKQVELIVQSTKSCTFEEQVQICLENKFNNPCHGDSGGPLHCNFYNKWYVFGVASNSKESNLMGGLCAGPGSQTVYARTAEKYDWIRTTISKYS